MSRPAVPAYYFQCCSTPQAQVRGKRRWREPINHREDPLLPSCSPALTALLLMLLMLLMLPRGRMRTNADECRLLRPDWHRHWRASTTEACPDWSRAESGFNPESQLDLGEGHYLGCRIVARQTTNSLGRIRIVARQTTKS